MRHRLCLTTCALVHLSALNLCEKLSCSNMRHLTQDYVQSASSFMQFVTASNLGFSRCIDGHVVQTLSEEILKYFC